MLVFRPLVGVALVSSAWAEECAVAEAASLIQSKPQRQKLEHNESDELAVNLLAHATGAADTNAINNSIDTKPQSDGLVANLLARATATAHVKLHTLGHQSLSSAVTGKPNPDAKTQTEEIPKECEPFEKTFSTKVDGKEKPCACKHTMEVKGPQNFENGAQTSTVTGNKLSNADEEEFAVLDKINEMRHAGFSCTDKDTGKVEKFEPKCRSEDLIFDCRLWFAAKQHSEDMGKRNYYAHDTQAPFPSGNSGSTESFDKRANAYAWGIEAHKEVLMGTFGTMDTPKHIVDAWLNSYEHCLALGTTDAEVAAVGRAPCTANGGCNAGHHNIGTYTGALFQRRGFTGSWDKNLDTSCYPSTRNKEFNR